MEKKKVLFVCTANLLRSVTAEIIFSQWDNLDVKSAGTFRFANNVITIELIEWADIIFAMQDHHKKDILKLVPKSENKIIVLNIPDIYDRMDPNLVRILKEKVPRFLQ